MASWPRARSRRRRPQAWRAARRQRPRRHRLRGRRRRPAPGAGRPATGGGPRHRRAHDADRPVHPRDRRGIPGADGGRRLLLRRPVLAHPTKPGRPAPGWNLVRAVAGMRPDKPWFAIGGIDEQAAGRGARRRGPPDRGGPGDHRRPDPGAAAGRLVRRWLLPADLGAAPGEHPLVISTVCGNGCRQSSWSSGLRVLVMRRLSQLSANPGAAATRSPRPRPPSATPNSPGWARCPAGAARRPPRSCRSRDRPAGPETSAVTTVARTCHLGGQARPPLVGLAHHRGLFGRLVAVPGAPGSAQVPPLMAPRGAVLQQTAGVPSGWGRAATARPRRAGPVRRAGVGIPPSRRRRPARVQDKHATRRFVGRSCPIRHSCS